MPVRIGRRYQVQTLPTVGAADTDEHAEPVCLYYPPPLSTQLGRMWGWWDILCVSGVLVGLRVCV